MSITVVPSQSYRNIFHTVKRLSQSFLFVSAVRHRLQVRGAVPAPNPDVGEDALGDCRGVGDLAGGAEEMDLLGGHLPLARHPLTAAGGVAKV